MTMKPPEKQSAIIFWSLQFDQKKKLVKFLQKNGLPVQQL